MLAGGFDGQDGDIVDCSVVGHSSRSGDRTSSSCADHGGGCLSLICGSVWGMIGMMIGFYLLFNFH